MKRFFTSILTLGVPMAGILLVLKSANIEISFTSVIGAALLTIGLMGLVAWRE